MSSDFELKKVPMETLGEYLVAVRTHLDLTLEEVAQKTEVFEKFILYLEEGKYQMLPPDVYVVGFLNKLAKLYKVSTDDLLTQFKKERGIVEHNAREKMVAKKTTRSRLKNLSITPKLLTISGSVLLGVIAFTYILVQVFSVNRTPNLTVLEPQSGTVLKSNSVTVRGTTDPGMVLHVNGQNVYVLPDGSFETTLSVASGQKDFTVVSKNKFGKESTEKVSLRIEDPQVAGVVTDIPTELVVELEFTKESTVTIQRDGLTLPEETVPKSSSMRIVATDLIIVTTSDAGNTKIILNGESLGALGKPGQNITVPFNKEAQDLMSNNSEQN